MPTYFQKKRRVAIAVKLYTYGYVWRFVHILGMISIFSGLIAMPSALLAQQRKIRLIAFGDSLTAGYMLPARAAFPAALERALNANGDTIVVVNAGVSGDTSKGGLERLDWALSEGADAMILELGANDMLRGMDPEITYNALKEIVRKVQDRRIKILLAGMIAAPGLGRNYEDKFNHIFPRLAEEMNIPLYPFFLEGVAGRRELLLGDGLHPTAAGVDAIVKGILPAVQDLLRELARNNGSSGGAPPQ